MDWFGPDKLVFRIALGVALGTLIGSVMPNVGAELGILGQLFVGLLKAIAPMLVLVLVASALANLNTSAGSNAAIAGTLGLYLLGTIGAALVALVMSSWFPQQLLLPEAAAGDPPYAVTAVFTDILVRSVDNPLRALIEANFLACLTWGVLFGMSFRQAPAGFRQALTIVAERLTVVVRWIIQLAPLGIMGLVSLTVSQVGLEALANYASIAALLVSSMLLVALVINPILVLLVTHTNPYPVIFRCLKESGVTAFFTRSSAANIPVNLALAERMKLSPSLYSVTIPVGATINMAGAAITITTLTLAAVNTLGIEISFWSSLVLCVVAALAACGASGVPSGSLLLIPLACGLFGI